MGDQNELIDEFRAWADSYYTEEYYKKVRAHAAKMAKLIANNWIEK